MFDHDDSVAAARFRDAVIAEPVHAEEEAASESAGATTYDFAQFRARRIRERLIVLLDSLAAAIDRRDLAAIWRVLDTGDACRCFPPGLREEALTIVRLPMGTHRVPLRLYRYQHLLTQLGDETIEIACDPARLAADSAPLDRTSTARALWFSRRPLPDDGPDSGGSRRRSGSR
jgi:hypothetical protein